MPKRTSISSWLNWIWEFFSRTLFLLQTLWKLRHDSVLLDSTIDQYNNLYSNTVGDDERRKNYQKVVTNYYNVSTLFYEWGWGPCFHFAVLHPGETFSRSLELHELELVSDLKLSAGKKVLDVGCGIGGPARNIARATKAHVTGLNINSMQIKKATELTKLQGLENLVDFVVGDFCKMEFEDSVFDAVFAIEATCHAPKREDIFGEIFRVLKPGGYFSAYEWCLTDKFDSKNEIHKSLIRKIEHGNGLTHSITIPECIKSLKAVGFEIVDFRDAYKDDKTWWTPLKGNYWRPSTFEFTPLGTWLFTKALQFMERVHLAPKGVVKISDMLFEAAEGLTGAGALGIYTTGFYLLVRKPVD